ncbi:hypothetical protein GCM10027063_38410 [Promicromonospora xylanilytica]
MGDRRSFDRVGSVRPRRRSTGCAGGEGMSAAYIVACANGVTADRFTLPYMRRLIYVL